MTKKKAVITLKRFKEKVEEERDKNVGRDILMVIGACAVIDDLDEGIKALEAQKTAHWEKEEETDDGRGMSMHYRCSECGTPVMLGFPQKSCDYDFCPYCGAKMEEEDES